MQTANVNGVTLEYEATGAGEPLLLISPVIADGFLPLLSEPALADRYRLIRYHKRGWVGSTHTPPPVTVADHAADAVGLLDHLDVRPVHIAGHSSGAAVALQLALDHPQHVRTVTLLEPSLIAVPSLEAFFARVEPSLKAYASGDHAGALRTFMTAVSGLEWSRGGALLEKRIPGAIEQAIRDADTFFGIELPALVDWTFGADAAATLNAPALSIVGSETQPVWVEVAEFLRSALPQVDECTIDGVGHLLQIERPEPVARAMVDFLRRHPIERDDREAVERPKRHWSPAGVR